MMPDCEGTDPHISIKRMQVQVNSKYSMCPIIIIINTSLSFLKLLLFSGVHVCICIRHLFLYKCCISGRVKEGQTDLVLSQSESLLRRLRKDQRERLLNEELRDHERDGGGRSTEGLPCSSSSTLDTIRDNVDERDKL